MCCQGRRSKHSRTRDACVVASGLYWLNWDRRWWSLRCEIKERGGGDVVTSSTTSDAEIAPQPPPARRVAGGAPPSASPALLSDVPHRLRSAGSHLSARRLQRRSQFSQYKPLIAFAQPLQPLTRGVHDGLIDGAPIEESHRACIINVALPAGSRFEQSRGRGLSLIHISEPTRPY